MSFPLHPTSTQFTWLQALRAIAALTVLFFHMQPHWEMVPALAPFSAVTRWGFSGVDIFFVLSGFVVYRSAVKQSTQAGIKEFFRKRFARIFPPYWCVLLLLALVALVTRKPFPEPQNMLLSTFLFSPRYIDNWLPPAWSLTYELYFYCWIGVVVFVSGRKRWAVLSTFTLALAVWNFSWLVFQTDTVKRGEQPLHFLLTALGLEFLAGALIAHVHLERRHWFGHALPLIFGGALLAIGGLLLGQSSMWFDRVDSMRAMSFGLVGCGTLLVALAIEERSVVAPAWLVELGNASFSLYLLHTLLLDISAHVRIKLKLTDGSLLVFMLLLPVAIALSSLLWHRCIERRVMRAVGATDSKNTIGSAIRTLV